MKVTLLFDEENQQHGTNLIRSWKLNHDLNYSGYNIKSDDLNRQLLAVEETALFVILMGPSTRFLSAQFIDDLKLIINSTKAILCLNLNGMIGLDEDNCPRILWDCGALHMPFSEKDFRYLLDVIKLDDKETIRAGSFHIRKHPLPYDME